MSRILEICCFSVESARRAQAAGADRIELCAGRPEGGTTPSYGMLRQASDLEIPVAPMVRPRGGAFTYRNDEFAAMLTDIELIRELGYQTVVTGILNSDLEIDIPKLQELMEAGDGLNFVFHRAFDLLDDPENGLQTLAELGVDRVLTSGGEPDAPHGIDRIAQLIKMDTSVTVMPGGGVRPNNVVPLLEAGAQEVHSSATTDPIGALDDNMVRELAALVHDTA